ncbi:TPA: hypothetical protein ACYSBI_001849 [Morganella morganii]
MIKIAGKRTISEWESLSEKLHDGFSVEHWEEALKFFDDRIEERYLKPVRYIRGDGNHNNLQGSGFAICTLLCALIENLETFYKGINFNNSASGQYEYSNRCSKKLFTDFLKTKMPFKTFFEGSPALADSFYTGVRCSLLHDASTCDGWVINIEEHDIIIIKGNKKILHRSLFMSGIEKYIKNYKRLLMHSENSDLREAFIRKFNGICKAAKTGM